MARFAQHVILRIIDPVLRMMNFTDDLRGADAAGIATYTHQPIQHYASKSDNLPLFLGPFCEVYVGRSRYGSGKRRSGDLIMDVSPQCIVNVADHFSFIIGEQLDRPVVVL